MGDFKHDFRANNLWEIWTLILGKKTCGRFAAWFWANDLWDIWSMILGEQFVGHFKYDFRANNLWDKSSIIFGEKFVGHFKWFEGEYFVRVFKHDFSGIIVDISCKTLNGILYEKFQARIWGNNLLFMWKLKHGVISQIWR